MSSPVKQQPLEIFLKNCQPDGSLKLKLQRIGNSRDCNLWKDDRRIFTVNEHNANSVNEHEANSATTPKEECTTFFVEGTEYVPPFSPEFLNHTNDQQSTPVCL